MKLKHNYTLYYQEGGDFKKNMTKEDFENCFKQVAQFETCEEFWELFLQLKLPTQMPLKSKVFIFKGDIRPTWEHQENMGGGRIFIDLPVTQDSNTVWQNLMLQFLTEFNNKEEFEDLVNGVEVSKKHQDNIKIALWTKHNNYRELKNFFFKMKRYVPLPKKQEFDFSNHPNHRKPEEILQISIFLNIYNMMSSSVITQTTNKSKLTKYNDVQSKLDTGMTIKDVVFLTNHQVVQKNSEVFKRISAKKMKELLESEPLSQSIIKETVENVATNSLPIYDQLIVNEKKFTTSMRRDYLLVDLRERSIYDDYHIVEAISIPAMHFNQDRLPQELMYYKNKDNRFIIVYHQEEEEGMRLAKLLVLKGYKNVVLLGGGIEKFGSYYPDFIEGVSIPVFKQPEPIKKKKYQTRHEPYKKTPKKGKLQVSKLPRKDQLRNAQNSQKIIESQVVANPSSKKNNLPVKPSNYKIVDDFSGREQKPKLNFKKQPIADKIHQLIQNYLSQLLIYLMEEENYMKCHFCDQNFDLQERQPRMIFDCGHSICLDSLKNFFSSQTQKFTCPQDGIKINLEHKTVDIFPPNQTLIAFLKQNSQRKSMKKRPSEKRHISSRKSFDRSQDNSFLNFPSAGNILEKYSSQYCDRHRKPMDTICQDDQQIICTECALFDVHTGHKVEKLNEFLLKATNVVETIKSIKSKLVQSQDDFQKTYFPIEVKPQIIKSKQDLIYTIKEQYKTAYEKLLQQEKQLLKKAEDGYEEFIKIFLKRMDDMFDFKDEIEEWTNLSDEMINSQNDELEQVFAMVQNERRKGVRQEGQNLVQRLRQIMNTLQNKLKDFLEHIKIEQKLSFDDFYFSLYFPKMALESQIYNLDNIGQDIIEKDEEEVEQRGRRSNRSFHKNMFPLEDPSPISNYQRPVFNVDLNETNENLMDDPLNYSDIPELNNQNLQNFNPTEMIKNDPSLKQFFKKNNVSPSPVKQKPKTQANSKSRSINKQNSFNQLKVPALQLAKKQTPYENESQPVSQRRLSQMSARSRSNRNLNMERSQSRQKLDDSRMRPKSKSNTNQIQQAIQKNWKGHFGTLLKKIQKNEDVSLELMNQQLDEERVYALSGVLLQATNAKKITFKNSKITDEFLKILIKPMTKMNLHEIDLSYNLITDTGFKYIIQLVEKNPKIRKILMFQNQIQRRNRNQYVEELKKRKVILQFINS